MFPKHPAKLSLLASILLLALMLTSAWANSSEVSLRILPFLQNERPLNSIPPSLSLSKGESLHFQLKLNQGRFSAEPEFKQLPQAVSIIKAPEAQTQQTANQRIYLLTALEAGTHSLGELFIPTDRGKRKVTFPTIEVEEQLSATPFYLGSARSEKLFLTLQSKQSTAYPGEQINASATLYIPISISRSKFANSSPSLTGANILTQTEYFPQTSPRARMIDGALYWSKTYPLQITLLDKQSQQIGPAQMLLTFEHTSYQGPSFARQQTTNQYKDVRLQSAAIPLEILPLPPNAPPSFRGTIGNYQLSLKSILPKEPTFGDPFYLEFNATGNGNLDLLPEPIALEEHEWNIELIRSQVIQEKTLINTYAPPTPAQAKKEFLLLLRPKPNTQAQELPKLGISYFNPNTNSYETTSVTPPQLPANYFLNAQEYNKVNNPQIRPKSQAQAHTSNTPPASKLLSPEAPLLNSQAHSPIPSQFTLLLKSLNSPKLHLWSAATLSIILLAGYCLNTFKQKNQSSQAHLLVPLRSAQSKSQAACALRQVQIFLSKQEAPRNLHRQLEQAQKNLQTALYQPQSQPQLSKSEKHHLLQLAKQALSNNPSPKFAQSQNLQAKNSQAKTNKKRHSRTRSSSPTPPQLLPAIVALLTLPLALPIAQTTKAQEPPQANSQQANSQQVNPQQEPHKALEQAALTAFNAQNWSLAYQLWNELGQTHGYSAPLCTHLGNAAYELKRPAIASLWYRRALLKNPNQPEASANLKLTKELLALPALDKALLEQERWLVHLTPILQAIARISWWLALALLMAPLLWKRKILTPWWIAGSACLLVSLGSLALAKSQLTHGKIENRLVLLQNTPLHTAPLRSAQAISFLPAGLSCHKLTQRGAWVFVEYPDPNQARMTIRGWLRQETAQTLLINP